MKIEDLVTKLSKCDCITIFVKMAPKGSLGFFLILKEKGMPGELEILLIEKLDHIFSISTFKDKALPPFIEVVKGLRKDPRHFIGEWESFFCNELAFNDRLGKAISAHASDPSKADRDE